MTGCAVSGLFLFQMAECDAVADFKQGAGIILILKQRLQKVSHIGYDGSVFVRCLLGNIEYFTVEDHIVADQKPARFQQPFEIVIHMEVLAFSAVYKNHVVAACKTAEYLAGISQNHAYVPGIPCRLYVFSGGGGSVRINFNRINVQGRIFTAFCHENRRKAYGRSCFQNAGGFVVFYQKTKQGCGILPDNGNMMQLSLCPQIDQKRILVL